MIQRLLKVVSVSEEARAKNDRPYRVVRFESSNTQQDGTPVLSAVGLGVRTVFDAFTDSKGNEFKADPLFTLIVEGKAKIGSLIEGQVVKVKTTPYRIEGSNNEATFYTCVLFAHEDMVTYINRQLKDKYACVVDEYGNLTASEQTTKPVAAPSVQSIPAKAEA